jgi:pimeloyl-ACP methyl ester carboxylesterase
LLADRHTLIAPDLAGFGRSDKPRLDYSRDFHLATLDGLLTALHIDGQVAVAGHSMGGILAALYASRHPGRIASLALVAAPFPREQRRPNGIPNGRVRIARYRALQRLLPLLSPLVRSPTFPRAVIADYMRHTIDSYRITSRALIWDPAVAEAFAGLAASLIGRPQLLLYSDQDTTIAADSLERWRAVLPDAATMIVPGAHQLLLHDHFAAFAGWYQAQALLQVRFTAL